MFEKWLNYLQLVKKLDALTYMHPYKITQNLGRLDLGKFLASFYKASRLNI